jgi:hypothetical protein
MPITMACLSGFLPPCLLPPTAERPAKTNNYTMRLNRNEWMGVAVVAGSIACFGSWLQGELSRAALARVQRNTLDSHSYCTGMSLHDTNMMDKGELWCGTVDTAHAYSHSTVSAIGALRVSSTTGTAGSPDSPRSPGTAVKP